jgi:hypothetical protein
VAAFGLGLGKAYGALKIAVIGDVDDSQARLVLASHLGAAAAWSGLRQYRIALGKNQSVPLFQPAVQRRVGEDQILDGVVAGALRALVNLPLAIEDGRKGWLAAAGAQGSDCVDCNVAHKCLQCAPSNAKF